MIDSVKIFYILIWNKQFYSSNRIPMQLIVPLILEQIWNELRSRKFTNVTCCTLFKEYV